MILSESVSREKYINVIFFVFRERFGTSLRNNVIRHWTNHIRGLIGYIVHYNPMIVRPR